MNIEIYTKVCLNCVMKDEWNDIQRTMRAKGYTWRVFRTTYQPSLHQKASKLWGDDNYIAFAVLPDGGRVAIGGLKDKMNEPEQINDKLVKPGKTKPVRKGKKNVQRLRKTKRPIRVDSLEGEVGKIKVETKARPKVS